MEPHVDCFRRIFSGRALFKGKLPRIFNGMPFCLGEKYYYMIVKEEGGIAPLWNPRATQTESARAGVL